MKSRGGMRRELSFSIPSPRKLAEITDLSKLSEEEPQNIKDIWTLYHHDQVHATGESLTAVQHERIIRRAEKCKIIILPIMKGDEGWMWMLSQFQDNAFLITYLGEYQKDPASAKPWMSCVLYDDLIGPKGVSLVRSDFLSSLTKPEAISLTKMLLAVYNNDEEYIDFVSKFNLTPDEFDVDSYLESFKTRKGLTEIKDDDSCSSNKETE